ncbi:DUF2235 domain-containing protein [uncultured Roseobacter sp.]|uniref:DUF2235 domain-containing protein n=1 Tax=uncultured Roseobacter sp. TaxID=114847 RepID=UPI0026284028|nr:DUF2235 domain-containing protein [uncultured Roseobacter sp.]
MSRAQRQKLRAMSPVRRKILRFFTPRFWRRPDSDFGPRRGPVIHVVILDGTMSSLEPVCRTNAGRAYHLCRRMGSALSIYYEPGLQWRDWRSAMAVMTGRGINRQIRRAYGYLASRYRPGDKIFLLGYSRGAYAVRSLAGVIDQMGLLSADHATERNIRDVYRHYEGDPRSESARRFAAAHCMDSIEIEMIGVWDTVKSLGFNAPVLWRLSEKHHAFHNDHLSHNVKAGYQALALDETRVAYKPVLWSSPDGYQGRVEQVWFSGTHGDVGGQLGGYEAARPLANIPLVWLLERAQMHGLPLPEGWSGEIAQDATAPMLGTFRGHGRWFITRRARKPLQTPSEQLHDSVMLRRSVQPAPRGWMGFGKTV